MIIVGDWSTSLADIDVYNYPILGHPKCRNCINEFITKESVIDIWRITNSKSKRFTWASKNSFRQSGLDFFLLFIDLLSLDPKVEFMLSYKSDHNPLALTFIKSLQNRGNGLWKFNNHLLQNQDFINMIKKILIKSTSASAQSWVFWTRSRQKLGS